MILQKAQTKSVSKPDNTAILVATQSSGIQGAVTTAQGNIMSSQPVHSNAPQLGYHPNPSVQSQSSYYNSYQSNRNRGNGRGRGYKGAPGTPFNQGFSMPFGATQYQVTPQPIGQPSYQSGGVQPYTYTQPQRLPQAHFTQNLQPFGTLMIQGSPSAVASPGSSWFFDSGATSHVTNDLSNLSTQQPYTGGTGVMVGNGNTLPIAHSGSSYEPSASQGSMSPGSLSNLSLY
ncbi:hypothetical protein Vadar_033799 [Vaccinium darrowii]|uniref:Uncharacterized protein n=1 Tax=Vaccinium darrowii TaxID=229202 RepID=A0ACB7Y3K6_9ERIC|nr:hypothetical protein Vadar_033799 [Vaccinium darrowii]